MPRTVFYSNSAGLWMCLSVPPSLHADFVSKIL